MIESAASVQRLAQTYIWDDEPAFREGLTSYLSDFGFKVRGTADRGKFLRALRRRSNPYDSVFLDMVDERDGPELVGLEMVRKIREDNPDLLIVALTGHREILRERLGRNETDFVLEAGADLVFDKAKLNLYENREGFARMIWTELSKRILSSVMEAGGALSARSVVVGAQAVMGRAAQWVDTEEVVEYLTGLVGDNLNAENYEAFLGDLPELIRRIGRGFAAYHSGKLLASGVDEDDVYRQARERVPNGLIMLQPISKEPSVSVVFRERFRLRPQLSPSLLTGEGD